MDIIIAWGIGGFKLTPREEGGGDGDGDSGIIVGVGVGGSTIITSLSVVAS